MSIKNKHKTSLMLISISLLVLISPAEAQAPLLSKSERLNVLALQEPKKYARIKMADYGWNKAQYVCLSSLWGKESAWNHKADNPKSTAFGIAQMLNEKSTHPAVQIRNGLRYIKHRYEKPCNAWKFWQRHNWY